MTLYYLHSLANANGSLVDIPDRRHRIADYFIWNTNDGNFLEFTTQRGSAQEDLTEKEILQCDYLDANISVPVFSEKACHTLQHELRGLMVFHKIEVVVK